MAQIAGEGGEAVRGVGEFQHLRGDEGEAGVGVEGGRQNWKLVYQKEVQVRSADFLPSCEINDE